MSKRRRKKNVDVWQMVDCQWCGAERGTRCVFPSGITRAGSHAKRIARWWLLTRKERRQMELFTAEQEQ